MKQFVHTYAVALVASVVAILLWISVALHGGWNAIASMLVGLGAPVLLILIIAGLAFGVQFLTRPKH